MASTRHQESQPQTQADKRHWETIAIWLTAIAVIPFVVTAYAASYHAGTGLDAFQATRIATFATAAAGFLLSAHAATSAIMARPALTRKHALRAAAGFGLAATAMTLTALLTIAQSFVNSL